MGTKAGLCLAGLLWVTAVQAEERLLIESIVNEPANTTTGIVRPEPGITMEDVVVQFGEPMGRTRPVGDPPVSRWIYEDFVVFFERERVIRAVVRKSRIRR